MVIAIVGPYPLSPNCICGGVESSVYGLAQTLCKNDEVDVFDIPRILGKDAGARNKHLTIHRYCNPGPHNQNAITRVNEMLRDIIAIHPDVVHIHGTGEFSNIIYRSIKEYGIKVLLTVHGLLHVEKWNQLKRHPSLKHFYQFVHQSRVEFDILNYADHVIVDTEYVANQIKEYQKKGRIKNLPWMYVIPQGINEAYLSICPSNKQDIILSVGSISRRKGHLYLLKAFDQVCLSNHSVRLIISGTLSDKEYYNQLLEYIETSPNKDRISVKVNLSQEELIKQYEQATIFALHSQEESQGIALVEAMASHLPVVATNVGGIPYVVKHGETGLLSNYRDTNSFAINLQNLLRNKAMKTEMALAAYEEALQYTWSQIAEAIRVVINRL